MKIIIKMIQKVKIFLAILIASLFFQNCTAWPALTALLALAGGDGGGALLLVPPGGGGSDGGGSGEAGAGETTPNAPSNLSIPAPAGPFTQGVAITPIKPTFEGTVTNCETTTPLPAGLSINSTTCEISGTPTEEVVETTYTIVASNAGGSTSATVTISVNPGPPAISFSGSPFKVTVSTTANIAPTNAGGTITSCAISPNAATFNTNTGLTFNTTTCAITGTARSTVSAATNYTITPTGGAGVGTAVIINVEIVDVAPSSLSASGSSAVYYQNTAMTPITFSAGGGAITTCSVSPSLPTGMNLNTSTCEITGTPTGVVGEATYTVTAGNSGGTTTQTVTFRVDGPPTGPLTSSVSILQTYYVNEGISTPITFTTAGGGEITTCTSSPALPAGVTVTKTAAGVCTLTGTPTSPATDTTYTITAGNPAGNITQTVRFQVFGAPTAPLNVSNAGPHTYYVGSTITNVTFTTSGGGLIDTCNVSPSLPAGLSLAHTNGTTCTLQGTPTVTAANQVYTITASNAAGSVNNTVTFRVNSPTIAFGTTSYSFPASNAITAFTPTITGGSASSCALSDTTLGLTANGTTCQITGTPLVGKVGTHNVTVSATIGGNTITSNSISITITPPGALSGSATLLLYHNVAMTAVDYTISGGTIDNDSCGISGAIAGLIISKIDGSTCRLTGTPSSIQAAGNHSISATYNGGTAATPITVNIEVRGQATGPLTVSAAGPHTYYKDQAIATPITFTTAGGGEITTCTSSPALPAGVVVEKTAAGVCTLSGTPTGAVANTTYTITAGNPASPVGPSATVQFAILDQPTGLTGVSPLVLYHNVAMTNTDYTAAGGEIATCGISPAIDGLTFTKFNATTCRLSGSPNAIKAAGNHTLSATNPAGTSNFTANIEVRGAPTGPVTVSNSGPHTYYKDQAIATPITFTTAGGGEITTCTSSPALPAGVTVTKTATGVCTLSGTPTVAVANATYTITASNPAGGVSNTVQFTILDQPTGLTGPTPLLLYQGVAMSATGYSAGGGEIATCGISPAIAGLVFEKVSATTCRLSGTPTAIQAAGNHTLSATNPAGTSNFTANIEVRGSPTGPVTVSNAGPHTYYVGAAIGTPITFTTAGGGEITTCTSSPELPAGVIVTKTAAGVCTLSGTPTGAVANATYTITAGNPAGGVSNTVQFAIVMPTIAFDPTTYTFTVGTAITAFTPTITGGSAVSCALSDTTLGLTANATTCQISGTPQSGKVGTHNVTVSATINGQTITSNSIAITINNAAPTISYAGSPFSLNVGSATTLSPTLGGGAITNCTASSLPSGLNINTSTCAISGTPDSVTAANSYTISATSTGGTTTVDITITVNPAAPTISYSPTTYTFNQGAGITTVSPTLGGGVVDSCAISPDLNAQTGLSFNTSTCQISGTPTTIRTATEYTVTATNAGGTGTATVTITVNAPAPANLTYPVYPSSFAANFAIASITPTYDGTVTSCSSSPALPAGLSLSSTCVLSGTPTTATASATYTITASNGADTTIATLTFAVVVPPTVQFALASSNSTNEVAGNRTVEVTLTPAAAQTVTATIREKAPITAGSGVRYTTIGTKTVTFTAGQTTQNIDIAVIDNSVVDGDLAISLEVFGTPTFATIGTQAEHVFTIIDDDMSIVSAQTLDCNSNGIIDHYRIELSRNVNDSTFPGYVENGLGTVTAEWLVAGRANVRLRHGTALNTACSAYSTGYTDAVNDQFIYLAFDEGGGVDSGAKPDVTTTASAGLVGTDAMWKMGQIGSGGVTEADRATPVIMSATGTTGGNVLTVVFSEDVYTATGAPACGTGADLDATDFTYTNTSGGGAGSIAGMGADTCAVGDRTVTLLMNANFDNGDNASDTVRPNLTLYDAANNSGNPFNRPVSLTTSNPTITSIEQFDVDKNGRLDQLKVTFSLNMTDSTIANADAAQFTVTGSPALTRVDSVTGGAGGGTIVAPNNDPGTANDSIVTVFLDNTTLSGTNLKNMSFTTAAGKWESGGFPVLSVGDLTSVISDKAPPVILTSVATAVDTNPGIQSGDKIVITFSEPTDKSITPANIATALTLSGGKIWGGISAINWNTAGDVAEVVFSGAGSPTVAPLDNITIANTVRDTAASPNESVGIVNVNPISGSFGVDTTPPYVLYASDVTATTLLIQFSEPMFQIGNIADCGTDPDRLKAFNCLANYTLTEDPANAGFADPIMGSLEVVTPSSVRVTLSNTFFNIRYKISVATTVSDQAVTPNAMGSPREVSFIGLEPLRVVVASPLTSSSFRLTFNKPAKAGMNVAGSAECNTTTECNKRYKLSPQLGDGNILTATLSGGGTAVDITHSGTQSGVAYAVIAANGRTGDGFNNDPADWIEGVTGGDNKMQASPNDRATFIGSGAVCDTLECGAFYDDPFQDGSTFSFAFKYDNKVYLGTNDKNDGAFRFDPNGNNAIGVGFRFVAPSCTTATGFGFISPLITTAPTCGVNSGPFGEVGAASFQSINLTIDSNPYELLLTGALKNNLDRVFYSQDKGTTLDVKNFVVTGTNGQNSKSTTILYGLENRVFVGLASDHGTNAPIGNRFPATVAGGVVTVGTAADLNFKLWPNLGKAATPSNPNSGVVSIDFMETFTNSVYIANNGGVVRVSKTNFLTGASPNNAGSVTSNFAPLLVTPSTAAGTALYSPNYNTTTGGGLGKVRPGEKAYPFIVKFQGDLYLARNVGDTTTPTTNVRGELWRCTPNGDGQCAAGDWTRIISGEETELGGATPTHKAIGALTTNGDSTLYVGFDGNSTNGAQVFRFRSTGGTKPTVTTSGTAITGGGWVKQGTFGLGSGSDYVISSVSVYDSATARYYMYVIIGDGLNVNSIKVARQFDVEP